MQHPLEGEPPAGEQGEVVVARSRPGIVDPVTQQVRDRQLLGSRGEQRGEHIGHAIAQQVPQPREEGVRVTHLRRAAPLPALEGADRVGGERSRVALEQRHPLARARQKQRSAEPGDAAPDHHRMHASSYARSARCAPAGGPAC